MEEDLKVKSQFKVHHKSRRTAKRSRTEEDIIQICRERGFKLDERIHLGTMADILGVATSTMRRWETMGLVKYDRDDRNDRVMTPREGWAIYWRCYYQLI